MPETTTPDLNFSPQGLYIGGEWQESIDGGTLLGMRLDGFYTDTLWGGPHLWKWR